MGRCASSIKGTSMQRYETLNAGYQKPRFQRDSPPILSVGHRMTISSPHKLTSRKSGHLEFFVTPFLKGVSLSPSLRSQKSLETLLCIADYSAESARRRLSLSCLQQLVLHCGSRFSSNFTQLTQLFHLSSLVESSHSCWKILRSQTMI